jgi:hypothetical protein
MVNPLLTILFDLFLIASALMIVAGMVAEYRASTREASVGGGKASPAAAPHSLHARKARRRYSHRVGAGHARRKLAA